MQGLNLEILLPAAAAYVIPKKCEAVVPSLLHYDTVGYTTSRQKEVNSTIMTSYVGYDDFKNC